MKTLYVVPYTLTEKGLLDEIYLLNVEGNEKLYQMDMDINYFDEMILELFPKVKSDDDLYFHLTSAIDMMSIDDTKYSIIIINVKSTIKQHISLKSSTKINNILNGKNWYDFSTIERNIMNGLILKSLKDAMPSPKK